VSLKDKLELGLKPDAPYRPDNLPDFQKTDPACLVAGRPGDSPRLQRARERCAQPEARKRLRRMRQAGSRRAR
jgi:hypothetical protein